MKVIKSRSEQVCEVHCTCCEEDHRFEVERNKNFGKGKWEDDIFYVKFFSCDLPLKERIREIRHIMKNFESHKNGIHQAWNGILLDSDQLGELYGLLYSEVQVNDILDASDLEYIDKNIDLKPIKFDDKDNWKTWILSKSRDGLVFSTDLYYNVDKEYQVADIAIGWSVPEEMTKKELRKRCIKYLFKRSNYYFEHYECFLFKSDVVELLAAMNAFLNALEDDGLMGKIKE